MDDGIKIVMSPVQLAAALSDKSVTEGETLSNRLYGGLGLVMGTLELAGATALCMVPKRRKNWPHVLKVLNTWSESLMQSARLVISIWQRHPSPTR